ncbi:Chromatin-remodeling complex ATPase chain [Phytophthora palmivora]|uniref:Chromatin-remodeling complex ATPase chain n=1 Tax=Phytophthora palmivora TaxID=4796 RepID=A0A2P4YDL3_9STRA|nr:Chromatin-remodeling complex ATPase chain [Phytophthora palmivora]
MSSSSSPSSGSPSASPSASSSASPSAPSPHDVKEDAEDASMDGGDSVEDNDTADDDDMDDVSSSTAEDTKRTLLSKEEREALRKEEETVLQDQRDRQSKSLDLVKQNLTQDVEWEAKSAREKKMAFLMAQSDVFTSFLMGGSSSVGKEMSRTKAAKDAGSKRGKGSKQADAQALQDMDDARYTRITQQPSIIKFGTMKPYQLEGLNWMIRLHDSGVNGILADEMGLGKTLQSISLLAYLREARGIEGPHIIIVPKSTVGNWMRELKRWCPSIKAFKFMGSKEERAVQRETVVKQDFDALVLSYEVAIIEKSILQKIKWRYLLIDEAHRVKNENSKLSRVVREFKVEHRLLITGTPLQNNLHELWALLNFLLPDVFSDSEDFDSWFNVDEQEGQENVIKKLHTILRPFLLRRLKSDVEHSLPPKIETKLYVGLSEMQLIVYGS